jgi:hypothetical protein
LVWSFDNEAGGWEPWSEIDRFETRDGALQLRATGGDPFLGSPFIEVRPRELDRIELTLRVTSTVPEINGELYWQTTGMEDFGSNARTQFRVPADNQSHAVVLKPDVRGREPIIRLRLDPADAPAEIAVESITIYCR